MSYLRNIILCETIIIDVHSRPTLVGVYSGDLIVGDLPTRLRLSLYSEFIPSKVGQHKIQLKITMGGKEFANLNIEADANKVGLPANVISPPMEIGIDKDIDLEISASIDGEDAGVILSKQIFKGDVSPAIVSRQPASQSPSAAPETT